MAGRRRGLKLARGGVEEVGTGVRVEVTAGRLRAFHAGREVAAHDERVGRRQRAVDPAHFEGVAGHRPRITAGSAPGWPPSGSSRSNMSKRAPG
jgi:hypothetical protein